MCGIAGKLNFNDDKILESDLRLMMDSLKHRGPDDEGLIIKDNIGIAHVRLSILDLSVAGHQPMYDNSRDYVVSFNGEIYNYLELKSELKSFYDFKSNSDTEVILASYLKWGKDCLQKFNGDWAFVIWHLPSGEVFGARDRYGIKPFYYLRTEDSFAFASEIKALLPFSARKANNGKVFDYLVYNRTDHTNDTLFEEIKKVPHGHYFKISGDRVAFERWYSLADTVIYNPELSEVNAVEAFRGLLDQSIQLRLRSDVPVGVSLSGGLDSSSLLGSMLEIDNSSNVNTFSAIYKGFEHADESKFIDLFSDQKIQMHFTQPNDKSIFNDIDSFVYAHGEPTTSIGPYAQYKVMELASKYVKVTLDGQGADEQLTGYLYFFGSYFKELLLSANLISLANEIKGYRFNHGQSMVYKYWLLYMLPTAIKNKLIKEVNSHIDNGFYSQYSTVSKVASDLYHPRDLNSSLLQHFEYKLEHLLKWDDHNAMHFSIESRVPFLDHNLVEFTLGLNANLKIRNGQTKYILREAMKNRLPRAIKERQDKKGFSTPADTWFRQAHFKEYIGDLLESNMFQELGVFDVQSCKNTYKKHLEFKGDYSKEIWKWINMKSWAEQFNVQF